MAIFKVRDRAAKLRWKQTHKLAVSGAKESYQFWGDLQSAYDTYTDKMLAANEKPVGYGEFVREKSLHG